MYFTFKWVVFTASILTVGLCEDYKERDVNCEHVQFKLLYLLEQTKNKPPTESRDVGVDAATLTSAQLIGEK